MSKTRWDVAWVAKILGLLVTVSCSHRSTTTDAVRKETAAACAKEGDRCELLPGKTGLA